MKKRFIYVMSALLLLGILFIGGSRLLRDDPAPKRPEITVSASFTGPNLVGYKQGVRQWSLQAASIEEVPEQDTSIVRLYDIAEGWMYRDGEPHVSFRAAEGTWQRNADELVLSGDVRIVMDDQTVTSHTLKADMEGENMHFIGEVVWQDDKTQIRADEAFYNRTNDKIEFRGLENSVVLTQKE